MQNLINFSIKRESHQHGRISAENFQHRPIDGSIIAQKGEVDGLMAVGDLGG
jgi:hypothetical protein